VHKKREAVRITEGDKRCPACGNTFPITTEFWYRNKYRADLCVAYCKKCYKGKMRSKPKGWFRAYTLKTKYNITEEAYAMYLESCENRCAICRKEFSQTSKTETAHVDHDHTTGKIRGLLCRKCNTGLGLFCDSENLLLSAVEYLRKTK
jgi:hypothetical protein